MVVGEEGSLRERARVDIECPEARQKVAFIYLTKARYSRHDARRQAGAIEVTPAMIEAGVAFAREFLGDAYPPMPLDEPELVLGIWHSMNAAAASEREKPQDRHREP